MDVVGGPVRLHSAGGVDRVPKQTVAWHLLPHDPSHDRARVDANADLEGDSTAVSTQTPCSRDTIDHGTHTQQILPGQPSL